MASSATAHPPAAPGLTGAATRRGVLPAVAAAAVAGGAALRPAARGDLWLDEIMSSHLASEAGSALGIFTRLHHDNNHHLQTLWVQLVGEDAAPVFHRLAAALASSATVALLAWRPLRPGQVASAVTAVLAAASYLVVHYGSEARGNRVRYSTEPFLFTVAGWTLSAGIEARRPRRQGRTGEER